MKKKFCIYTTKLFNNFNKINDRMKTTIQILSKNSAIMFDENNTMWVISYKSTIAKRNDNKLLILKKFKSYSVTTSTLINKIAKEYNLEKIYVDDI